VLKRQLQLFYGEIYFAVLDRQATHAGRKAVAVATALQKVAAFWPPNSSHFSSL
jgi:hypothetical protein